MTDSVCPLPTKQVDEQYNRLISQYKEIGPDDQSFKEAIEELMKFNPSTATKALMQCERKGGKKSRKSRKARRGGAPSKKTCYIKALGKITMGVAGLGAAGYYYLMPFVASATGSPCAGLTDQVAGYFGSWVDPSLSCAYRQKAFDDMTMNYITNIAKLTGISVGAAILKAPKAFKSILKYLAAKECPELFENYSLDDLKKDLSIDQAPSASAQAQPMPPASVQPVPQYQPEVSRQQPELYESYYEDPEESVPARRSSRRTRRGGRKQRKMKTRRGAKTSRKYKHKSRRTKRRQTHRRRY